MSGRDNARVQPLDRASSLDPGYLSARVNGRAYETVITAAGYEREPLDGTGGDLYPDRGSSIARKSPEIEGVWRIGPCANIPFDPTEDSRIGENRVGLFRLAPRTAALAAQLGAVS